MKRLGENIGIKFIIVVSIVISMLFSNLLPIIALAVENTNDNTENSTTEDEYVKFNLTWNSDATTVVTDRESTLNSTVTACFKLEFNTIKEGFKNFKVVVTNEKGTRISLSNNRTGSGSPFESISGNTLYLQDTTNAGTVATGNIQYTFSKSQDEDFLRNLEVKLIGTYEKDGEIINVEITKKLTASLFENSKFSSLTVSFTEPGANDSFNKDYKLSKADKLNKEITKLYRLSINGRGNYTQAVKIKLIGLKSGSSENNNRPTNIRLASENTGYTLGEYNAEKGSIELIRGDKDAERDNSKLFNASQTIDIYVDYSIEGEMSDISGHLGVGYYFNLNLNAGVEAVGYDYYNGPEGEKYTQITLNKATSCSTKEFIDNSTSMGFGPECTYGGNFEKTVSTITEKQIDNIKNGGTEVVEYMSSFNLRNVDKHLGSKLYSYNYNFTRSDASIPGMNKSAETLDYEKSFVDYNGQTKYIEPTLNKITIKNLTKASEGAKIKFYKRGDIEGVDEPFFIATTSSATYTAPEGSNIKEYYAVYDTSEVDEDVFWSSDEASSYWYTGWEYNKEIIGIEDAYYEKITGIGRYQETVLNRNVTNIWCYGFYNHNEDWSEVRNFAEGVSANVTMKFDIDEAEKEQKAGKVRIKKILLSKAGYAENTRYFIYKIGQTPGVDEPIATLTKENKLYKPDEDIEGFIVVQDIKNLKDARWESFCIAYEYEVLDDSVSDLRINLQIESDSKTYNYDKETSTITSTTKGEVYNDVNSIGYAPLNKNFSITSSVYYNVTQKSYYFNLNGSTSDVSLNSVGVTTSTWIDINVPQAYYDNQTYRRINNPVLYLRLSNDFEYDYDTFEARLQKSGLKIDKTEFMFKNGQIYFVIRTKGDLEYYAWQEEGFVDITFYKRLKPDTNNSYKDRFELYMSDEYENYLNKVYDDYDLDGDGETSDVIFHTDIKYNYYANNGLYLKNNVKDSKGRIFTPSALIEKGKKATMQLNTENNYTSSISDISIIARLPFVGNKSVKDKTTSIGEDGKEITPKFDGNVKLYKNNSTVGTNSYTVGYSTDELADINSEFTYITPKSTYTEEEIQTISSAKTIIIKYNSYLYSKAILKVEYDITIPEDAEDGKMAGQQFLVNYKYSNTKSDIESAPAYAVVGEEKTTDVTINKVFEGTTPSASKNNIHFTIKGINNDNTYEATTDESGTAKVGNVKAGIYEITEDTTFDSYRNDTKVVFEVTVLGGSKTVEFKNPIKRGNVIVHKKWENTEEQVGRVEMKISGTTASGDNYSLTGYTASDGTVIFNVPYGTYQVSESRGEAGWYADNVEVLVNAPEISTEITNKIGYGNLEIKKTVPEGDNAKGLKFHLYGIGDASYKDENGILIQQEVDRTITIGDNGIGLEAHIPLGTYTLEEIEMPNVTTEDGTETRYIPYKTTIEIKENSVTEHINVENKWKTGELRVTVTATEGTDLELFRVRVHGNSSYGTEIDKEYNVPSNGKLLISGLPLGRYKVEECNTKEVNGKIVTTSPDGYEVTYNPEDVNEAGVKIQYNKISEAKIHNEYNGTGIIKITKTLEGETDKSKAEGIKFKVKGKDGVGKSFETEITIGKDGTGTSGPIPVGTYALTEIEDTVPIEYQIADEKEITVTTENTEENPLVLNIENKLVIRKNSNGNRNRRWPYTT